MVHRPPTDLPSRPRGEGADSKGSAPARPATPGPAVEGESRPPDAPRGTSAKRDGGLEGESRPPAQGTLGLGENAGQPRFLDGTLERTVFENPATHWVVARLVPDDPALTEPGEDCVTVVGPLYEVAEGTPLRLSGAWQVHPRYGRQFQVETYRTKAPETRVGIERYLASGAIRGVGPELARRLVDRFGLDTLEVISDAPERLEEVDGIGRARAASIARSLAGHKEMQDVMVFLHGYGVSPALAARIYRRYEQRTMAEIRKNPYRLALDVWGIGFKTADSIARNLGLEATAPERLEAGLIHALGQLAEDGHVHAPEEVLRTRAAELLGLVGPGSAPGSAVAIAQLPAALDRLARSRLVVREVLGDRGPCASLTALWRAERAAAESFAALVTTPMKPLRLDMAKMLARFEQRNDLELVAAQRQAIEAALVDKCVVITGGPGVGKTTIVRAIVSIAGARSLRIALAAPTGRAAKRLSDSTDREAVTLHRLLEFQPKAGSFLRSRDNPLDVDMLVVDEVSMVDIALFDALLDALPPRAQLVLVGDVDQLPSVGPGTVLADVIASEAATVVRLTEVFRQAARSHIIRAAHQVNRGEVPTLAAPPGRDAFRADFYFVPRDDPAAARHTVVDLVAERIPATFGLEALADIQVLSPMHRGELGTRALNDALQERINPRRDDRAELVRGDRAYRVGDKVMQIKNDYEKSVFNGDIGAVQGVVGKKQTLWVEFDGGRTVEYQRDDLDQLIHAYAVTVHKSQGSEYPAVVLALARQHHVMLQRNLLYTAITRGKQLVVVVGSRRAVIRATQNRSDHVRWTWLAERIRAAVGD